MSGLRAPDPTLDNYIYDVGLDFRESIITAHRLDGRGCDAEVDHPLPGPVYAYTAVPCRECFPDAPPAGMKAADDCSLCIEPRRHPDRFVDGLAWQVNP